MAAFSFLLAGEGEPHQEPKAGLKKPPDRAPLRHHGFLPMAAIHPFSASTVT